MSGFQINGGSLPKEKIISEDIEGENLKDSEDSSRALMVAERFDGMNVSLNDSMTPL